VTDQTGVNGCAENEGARAAQRGPPSREPQTGEIVASSTCRPAPANLARTTSSPNGLISRANPASNWTWTCGG